MHHIIAPDSLSAAQRSQLQLLTRAPAYAWPTLMLWAFVMISLSTSYVLGFAGLMPLWLGAVINSLLGYIGFTLAHDCIHRAMCRDTKLNDRLGQMALWLMLPYVHLGLFRWGHIQHHRFTGDARDPDLVMQGPWWQLPLRWAFIDLLYFVYVLRMGDAVARGFLRKSLIGTAIFLAAVAVLIWQGYGEQVLMLWLIPSRLLQMMQGFAFFWLPHVPHDTPQSQNFTRATTVRLGHEWLLDPLLQFQNYHLMHHLYPTTPFYNNGKVWRLLRPQLEQHDLAIQKGFAIHPEIHLARSAG
ncbi:Fatty acid desaturase [Solimonas aquatica]|uniref:Fatty acid desaturase n=1 Tax=Solimonas aquatica TaxID=489703 RepID=A0A1H9DLY6_9GAMM|nr:fatty acid desaturase [Solimonas aquatica]SEQ13718.1 Fatty acid desaturase [Solimonas aquatica]